MLKVGILGATGYAALELIKILLRHPSVEITALTTRQSERPHVHEVHPSLYGQLDLCCENLTTTEVAERADFVFSSLPHGASMAAIPSLLDAGCRIVDLSADYRLNTVQQYQQWYGLEHTDTGRLASTPYGLPELGTADIVDATFVANPGCYPSTAILGLAPLLQGGLISADGIIIDAKSGVSGAGRAPKLQTLFAECNESFAAYAVGQHRHTGEIDQVLSSIHGNPLEVVFTPHLVPMQRGLLCTMYGRPQQACSAEQLLAEMRSFYQDSPFIRVVEHLPATRDVSGTNYCDMTVRVSRGQVIVISATDNLLKGAAGVAVQNMNLMCGFPETAGILPDLTAQSVASQA